MPRSKLLIGLGSCILLWMTLVSLQLQMRPSADKEHAVDEFVRLPSGDYLKAVALGYDQVMADILWLRAIQVIGDDTVSPQGYDWIYRALDAVTTLDPQFEDAYQLGGVILSVLGKAPEKSNALLLKGLNENPRVWQIPFYIGFNYFFYLDDFGQAASYMARASLIPGHPAYLPRLAARLYVQAGDSATALVFLEHMLEETKDPKVQEGLHERIRQIRQGDIKGTHVRDQD